MKRGRGKKWGGGMEGEEREGRSLRHGFLAGGGRPEISPPRSFLKVVAYASRYIHTGWAKKQTVFDSR